MPTEFYKGTIGTAVEGMLANMEPKTIISRMNEDTAMLGFGKAVFQGATDRGVTTTVGTAAEFVGITALDRSAYVTADQSAEGFRAGDEARILRRGVIWVKVAAAVAPRDPVHIAADGTFTNTGGVAIPGASYDNTAAADGLAKVRIDQ